MLARFARSAAGSLARPAARSARLLSAVPPSSSSPAAGGGERRAPYDVAPYDAPAGESSAEHEGGVGDLTQQQMRKIGERFDAMRRDHHALKTDFPAHAQAGGAGSGDASIDAAHAYRKRLVYRSKQRGWLEVDLLMGTFAERHVWEMSEADLAMYEDILNEETIDIFNFITEKEASPPHLDNAVMARLQAWCASGPLGSTPEEYAAAKASDGGLT